jgi:hypothetical protein
MLEERPGAYVLAGNAPKGNASSVKSQRPFPMRNWQIG